MALCDIVRHLKKAKTSLAEVLDNDITNYALLSFKYGGIPGVVTLIGTGNPVYGFAGHLMGATPFLVAGAADFFYSRE
jgi:hypothetical protein